MTFTKILHDIKNLKIQGAQNIAKSSILSLREILDKKHESQKELLRDLYDAKAKLFHSRPTEPCMRNALNYVFTASHTGTLLSIKSKFKEKINYVQKYFADADSAISQIGAKKIMNGAVVYTHCRSGTVVKILIQAKEKNKKNFQVNNTETRPLFQGRLTATELAKEDIPVNHFVDSALRLALKPADLVLIGIDAISSEGKVVNKIGSELIAEMAYKYDIPLYVCGCAWKFDPQSVFGFEEPIEKRFAKEVWDKPPKGITINNYAFEKVKTSLITGIISELGIFKPSIFIEEVKKHYPWMMRNN